MSRESPESSLRTAIILININALIAAHIMNFYTLRR